MRGIEIEKIYAKCLANKKNYECYMSSISGSKAEERTGTFLPNEYAYIIDFIVADKGIDKSKIIKIETADIGNLKLKPDVYVEINLSDGSSHEVGISIKSTDESTVSFHEKRLGILFLLWAYRKKRLKMPCWHSRQRKRLEN